MNPFLKMLLGQQAGGMPGVMSGYGGGTFNADGSVATPVDNEIVVEAPRNNSERGGPVDGMSVPNDRAIEAVQADIKRGQEASDRRGMFGTKGTLRDVLGLVGDAFLVQGGRDPYYAPRRRQEQISDAWAGATENPYAAAERVGYYDAKMGQDLIEQAKNDELKTAQFESLQASRKAKADDDAFARYRRAREMLGGLFNTPGAVVNGQISPAALQQATKIAASAGMTLEEFMISEGMTEQEVRDYAASSANFYQQERLEDYDTGLAQGQQNADSRRISANASMIRAKRPPAGRAPRAKTDGERFDEFRSIPESKRTKDQQDFIDDYVGRNKGRGSSGRGRGGREAPKPSVSNW